MKTIKTALILVLTLSWNSFLFAENILYVNKKLICHGDYYNGPNILKRNAILKLELLELNGELKYYTISDHYFGPIDANVASPLQSTYERYINYEAENGSLRESLNLDRHSLELRWTRYRSEWTPSNIDFYGYCKVENRPKI